MPGLLHPIRRSECRRWVDPSLVTDDRRRRLCVLQRSLATWSHSGQERASLDGRFRAVHHGAAKLGECPWTCIRADPAKPRRSATSIVTTKCARGTAARRGRITDRFRIGCSACEQPAVRCMAPTVPTSSSADVRTARAALQAYPSRTSSMSDWRPSLARATPAAGHDRSVAEVGS
jgi:hypothetical protein